MSGATPAASRLWLSSAWRVLIIAADRQLVGIGAGGNVGAVKRLCVGVLTLMVAGWVPACVTAPDPEAFEVTVVNLAGGNATVWETEAVVTVRLQNATPNDITITGAAHKLYLNGTYVGQGLANETITVPRLSSTTQNVTVHLKNFTVVRKLIGMQETRVAAYKVRSTIYGAPGGGTPRSFRAVKEGSVNLDPLLPPPATP